VHIPENKINYLLGYTHGPLSGEPRTGGDDWVGLEFYIMVSIIKNIKKWITVMFIKAGSTCAH